MNSKLEKLAAELSEYRISLNDFEIGQQIGHGGFSEVYIGMQTTTGKLCAIKILNAKDLHGDSFVVYEREVSILAKGRNLFLLRFVGFTTSHPFTIVTEFASKGSLYDALHHKIGSPILTGTQKTIIAMGIAYGMHRLHKIRVIHRDLKSLNVLLDDSCLPKICDFGLSRYIDNPDTYLTVDIGTPHWMAPELFTTHDYTNKVDVYSYGILLWELLTGTYPFRGLNSVQIAFAVCKEQARPEIPRHASSSLTPRELRELISLCWHQDPAARPLFHSIYKKFANHEVCFPGTDQNIVAGIVDLIRKDKIASQTQSRSKLLDTPVSSTKRYFLSEQYKSTAPIPIFTKHNDDFSAIRDSNSPNFCQDLNELKNNLKPFQAESFFQVIKPHFRTENLEALNAILTVTAELINKAPDFFQSFLQMQMMEFLPFSRKELIDPIYQILVTVFLKSPALITKTIICQLPAMCRIEPLYVLHLINIYTCMHAPMQYFWDVADILITSQDDFIQKDSVQQFLKLLFTLIQLFETYRQNRQQHIGKICIKVATTQLGEPMHLAYQLLSFLLIKNDFQIGQLERTFVDAMIRHINKPEDADYALSFLIRLPSRLPYILLIPPIALHASRSQVAAAILIEYVENEEMATKLIETIDILQPLPTIDYSIRLLLTILRFQSITERVVMLTGLQNFLVRALMTKSVDVINAAATIEICLCTKIHHYVNTFYESKFLPQFFETIVKHDNSVSWNIAGKMINFLSNNGFHQQFLSVLVIIENVLAESSFGVNYAIAILKVLMKLDEIRNHIENSDQFPNCARYIDNC
ncbi:TKL family protein kinase [Tritrichomonas foetus]|uniref:TKL family protein kinase n=1 Tax=Tritrichomonas foetus TaxID=1144522 RepID=A0A1J4J724_9EUKA|nr:TKL family protein kinase [Tritrichomonas foetus]|eukprot:OHS93459.1 TKL family protein kinase [Tritrichomonas foetus]